MLNIDNQESLGTYKLPGKMSSIVEETEKDTLTQGTPSMMHLGSSTMKLEKASKKRDEELGHISAQVIMEKDEFVPDDQGDYMSIKRSILNGSAEASSSNTDFSKSITKRSKNRKNFLTPSNKRMRSKTKLHVSEARLSVKV